MQIWVKPSKLNKNQILYNWACSKHVFSFSEFMDFDIIPAFWFSAAKRSTCLSALATAFFTCEMVQDVTCILNVNANIYIFCPTGGDCIPGQQLPGLGRSSRCSGVHILYDLFLRRPLFPFRVGWESAQQSRAVRRVRNCVPFAKSVRLASNSRCGWHIFRAFRIVAVRFLRKFPVCPLSGTDRRSSVLRIVH